MYSGIYDLPWWGYVVFTLAVTHITIAGVTIYLHRYSAHRALELNPLVSHFFRFWLWLTTGMVTKEWTAVHRKHHAKCETEEDPHSPQVLGLGKVLWQGADLYRAETGNKETLARYGHGTPNDWIERNLYTRFSVSGVALLMVINFVLFGFIGVLIWTVQMYWIPFFAAGVINGIGHYWGYRNFQAGDASTNIVPWGILIGGEELHNNHHAYASSARLSNKWWEFDIGWFYIRTLEIVGLAKVRKVAPQVRLAEVKEHVDAATLQAIITHRYDVLTRYARTLKSTCALELEELRARAVRIDRGTLKRWLQSADVSELPPTDRASLDEAIRQSRVLATVHSMRQDLAALWQRSTVSSEQLLKQLDDWCSRAEASGIAALQEFSRRLRSYA